MDDNGKYGYVIMEHDYPNDDEIYECETWQEASEILQIILSENNERKVYIRKITKAEVYRTAMLRASRM